MIRKIIRINRDKCNGCGACVTACHEGAIGMVDGKAELLKENYCDGLGDCLPACPTGAISFETREAAPYDEKAVEAAKQDKGKIISFGCPGKMARSMEGALRLWPVQIKLVPVNAPWFWNSDLLVAADCTAFAFGDFHNRLMKGRITLVGCPKLDSVDYSEKLTEIIRNNEIRSITVARMEVPCCGGIEYAVAKALAASGKQLPCRVVTVSTDGKISEEKEI